MVKSCCAYGCTEKARKGSGISFHSFPKNEDLRKKWVIALKREHFQPTSNSRICGKHFLETDYVRNFGQLKLKDNVVPSIFNFPPHLIKRQPKIRTSRSSTRSLSPPPSKKLKINVSSTISTSVGVGICTSTNFTNNNISAESSAHHDNINTTNDINLPGCSTKREIRYRKTARVMTYFGDYKYEKLQSNEAKMLWKVSNKQIQKYKKVIKHLRNKKHDLQKSIKRLKDLIIHLKQSKKISQDCSSILQECIPEAQKQLVLKQLKINTDKKYPEQLRTFALTLNFYSSSAYTYVRNMFSKCLPHPKTLLRWYESVDGSPGYTKESLRAIELKVKEMAKDGRRLICSLMMDEMSIRRHIQWNGKRQVGYVNYGFDMESDALPEAKDAIAFLLVAVNSRWKLPVGYFLINGLSAEEKANLVKGCLGMLSKVGVEIVSLTFDGAASNLSMANILGADFSDFRNLKTYFIHPITNCPVYILLDACHMIKLIRNLLGDWGILYDKDGNAINWIFFICLVRLQEKYGLQAATKLRNRHINYFKEKMKVKLAVQTLSDSVADALLYCCEDLKLEEFQGAYATANFCRIMNNVFDIMNTRNSLSKNPFKKPVSKSNIEFINTYFNEAKEYIYGLKNSNGESILKSRRKVGLLGLLVNMASIQGIVNDRILEKNDLEYLLTYKLSQDHLEMFFSNIRSRGGFNNNPTAAQFESAYKKLLVHVELKSSEAANCLSQDETSILKVTSTWRSVGTELDLLCSDAEGDNEVEIIPCNFDRFTSDVVEYIAGFVCRKLIKSFNCNICCSSLTSNNSLSLLLNKKNKGGLKKPSLDVINICKIGEGVFKTYQNLKTGNVINNLILKCVRQINFNIIFQDLHDHLLDQDPLNNHLIQVVYNILKVYFTIRLHHRNKTINETKEYVRHMYTKLIHFKGQ